MAAPLLSTLLILPALGAFLIALLPPGSQRGARTAALIIALANLILSLFLLTEVPGGPAGFQWTEDYPWIPALGVTCSLGVDGISSFLVLLVTGLAPIAVLSGWHSVQARPRGFYTLLTLVQSGLIGVLCARDAFLFYVFWEVMLLPMFFLIGLWGRTPVRVFATVKFMVYTMAGSLLMLLSILYVGYRYHAITGIWSFAIADWYGLPLAPQEQVWLFWGFVLAFAVKIPLIPLHTWLPDVYSEAPTPVLLLLSGVMAKLGAYGLIRLALPLFPQAVAAGLPVLRVLALIGILYCAAIALVQTDIKRLIAYASISHLGFVVLGIAAADLQGLQGAIYHMIGHALSTGALFLLAGMLEDRCGTTQIDEFGGLASVIPWYAAVLLLVVLSSAGLPGLNGFVGEFLILIGAFQAHPATATLAASGMIWGACYLLWLTQRILFGPTSENLWKDPVPGDLPVRWSGHPLPDLNLREWTLLVPILGLIVLLGLVPKPLLDRMAPAAQQWVQAMSAPGMVPVVRRDGRW